MTEEFNLSDKIKESGYEGLIGEYISPEDVKEYIKLENIIIADFVNRKITLNEFLRRLKSLRGDKFK